MKHNLLFEQIYDLKHNDNEREYLFENKEIKSMM